MMNFFKQHGKVILIGILGLALGAFLNYLANEYTNKQLLASITAQINALKGTGAGGRMSITQQSQLIQLQAQQSLLSSRIGICSDCSQSWQKQNCTNCQNS